MNTLKPTKLILAALAGTLFTTLALAQPAVEWSGGQTDGGFAGPMETATATAGYRFKVTSASDIEATALGVYDSGGNGLGSPHIVAIWPVSGGAPLAVATVPAGAGAFLEGHFRYVNITPVRLFKDTEYIVGASDFGNQYSTNDPAAFRAMGFTNSPGVEWVTNQYAYGFGLVFPESSASGDGGYSSFGGNFKLQPVPSIPLATIRCSQVEVCWTSVTNQQYQVQYHSALTTNAWLDLGSPIPGTGTNNCINDPIPAGQPQRFYRILALP